MNEQQISELKTLVEINSYTQNKAGVDTVAAKVLEYLSDLELDWEITESETKGNLYFAKSRDWDEDKPAVLLSGHLDTVFEENWPVNIEDGKFYGPGTLDMKAGLMVIVEVLRGLAVRGGLKNVMVLLTPDEENGMIHISKQNEYYKLADYTLIFEEGNWTRPNPDPKVRALVVKRKAAAFYEVNFTAPGGHHGRLESPELRHSAIAEAAKKVLALESLADYAQGTLVNVGTIKGGLAPNVISPTATLEVDVRAGNAAEMRRFDSELANILVSSDPEVTISYERKLFYPSFDETPESLAFAERVIRLGSNIGLDINIQRRSSASEANWISSAKPECIVLDGMGVIGDGDHSEGEYFYTESFQQSVDLSLTTISEILVETTQ